MKKVNLLAILLIALSTISYGQWSVGAGLGLSFPITGYAGVVKPGVNVFNLHANHALRAGYFKIGMNLQMSRFAEDNNPKDEYYDAKLTVAPFLFTLDYNFMPDRQWQPYLGGGLGISGFVVSYNSSPTEIDDQSDFNVSFTMMPKVGIRYKASEKLFPFFETGLVAVMDGPPVGFPEGEKVTGYQFISLGVSYTFTRQVE